MRAHLQAGKHALADPPRSHSAHHLPFQVKGISRHCGHVPLAPEHLHQEVGEGAIPQVACRTHRSFGALPFNVRGTNAGPSQAQ